MNSRDELRDWLREQISCVEQEGGLGVLCLQHFNAAGQPQEVHSLSSKTPGSAWGDAERLADLFDSISSRFARGLQGSQQFMISAVWGVSSGKAPTRTLPFLRAGASHVGPSGLSTEGPSDIGRTMQAMRSGEQLTQGTFSMNDRLLHSQQAAIDARDRYIEKKERENAELWLGLKSVTIELDQRRHGEKLAELSAARMAEFQKQVMMLAPALLNMMAGREVFPLNAADTATLDTIAAMASGEDLRMLTSVLSQKEGGAAIAATLTDRFDSYHKRKAAEAATERRLLNELPDRTYDEAERDAAGDAIRILKGRPHDEPKTLPPNGTNGHGASHGKNVLGGIQEASSPSASDDGELIADLFGGLPEAQIAMLIGVLGADKPDLAARLKTRLAVFKEKG